jgi:hypothetical protein
MELFGLTLSTTGTLFIALAALNVHHRVLNEHKIDQRVFREMKREQWIGISGVALLVVGHILVVVARFT